MHSYLASSMGLPPSDPPSPTIRISVTRGTESGSRAAESDEEEEGFMATGVVASVSTSAAAKQMSMLHVHCTVFCGYSCGLAKLSLSLRIIFTVVI